MPVTLNGCPRVVGVYLHGAYGPERLSDLSAELKGAWNAEVVLVDVRDGTGFGAESLREIAHLRRFLQGVCSVRVIGADEALRARIVALGLERDLQIPDALSQTIATAYLDAGTTR